MIQNIECVYNICMCVLAGTDRCLLIVSSSTCWDGVKICDINLLAWNSCEPRISNLQTSFRFRLRGVKSTATQWYREAALSTASSLTLQIQQTFRWMQNCRMLCYGTEFPRLVNLMLRMTAGRSKNAEDLFPKTSAMLNATALNTSREATQPIDTVLEFISLHDQHCQDIWKGDIISLPFP